MRCSSGWASDASSVAWRLLGGMGGVGVVFDESAFFPHTLAQLQPHLHFLFRDSLSNLQEDVES